MNITKSIHFVICSEIYFHFKYYDNISDEITNVSYKIPFNNSKVFSGSCGEDVQKISIAWTDKFEYNLMNITFNFNHVKKRYSLNEITMNLSGGFLPGGNQSTNMLLFYHGNDLETSINSSFYSEKDQILPLTNNESVAMGSLELSNIWFEAHNKIPLCKVKDISFYDKHKDTSTFQSNCCLDLIYFWLNNKILVDFSHCVEFLWICCANMCHTWFYCLL